MNKDNLKSLYLKLAIGIVLIFSLLLVGMAVYPRLRFVYYSSKLKSKDPAVHRKAREALLRLGEPGRDAVRKHYEKRIDCFGVCTGEVLIQSVPHKRVGIGYSGEEGDILLVMQNLSGENIVLRNFNIIADVEGWSMVDDSLWHLPAEIRPDGKLLLKINPNDHRGVERQIRVNLLDEKSAKRRGTNQQVQGFMHVCENRASYFYGEFHVEINGKMQKIRTKKYYIK